MQVLISTGKFFTQGIYTVTILPKYMATPFMILNFQENIYIYHV